MKTIDLSTPLYHNMPVFPGDPEVIFKGIEQNFDGIGFYMQQMTLCTHDGTHVNVPAHTNKGGKTLDQYPVDAFFGPAVVYESEDDIAEGVGLIFSEKVSFTMDVAEKAIAAGVPFVGLEGEFDLAVEEMTLAKGLISYERLVNVDQLPKHFMFHGVPLSIKDADGSPVRAFAVVEE